jgi:hypothetical protein
MQKDITSSISNRTKSDIDKLVVISMKELKDKKYLENFKKIF